MRLIDADRLIERVTTTPNNDGWSCTGESEEELIDLIKSQPTSRDLMDCINELCLRCGNYKHEHTRACNNCRWYMIKRGKA